MTHSESSVALFPTDRRQLRAGGPVTHAADPSDPNGGAPKTPPGTPPPAAGTKETPASRRPDSNRGPLHYEARTPVHPGPHEQETSATRPAQPARLDTDPATERPQDAPTSELIAQMAQVLADLEVWISHGTTQGFEPIAAKSGFGDRAGGTGHPPGGELRPPHEHWRQRWDTCTTNPQRRAVLDAATDELAAIRKRTLPKGYAEKPELEHQRVARFLKAGEGIPLNEAATSLRCSPSELRRIRRDAGRDIATGKTIEVPDLADVAEKVRQLRQHHPGMSVRDIARRTGLPKSTVHDHLAAA